MTYGDMMKDDVETKGDYGEKQLTGKEWYSRRHYIISRYTGLLGYLPEQ